MSAQPTLTLWEREENFRRATIFAALAYCEWNRTHTARHLGIRRNYLARLIRDLGIKAPAPPRPRARRTSSRPRRRGAAAGAEGSGTRG